MPEETKEIHLSQIKGVGIIIGIFFTLINFIAAGITALLLSNFTRDMDAFRLAIQPIQQNTRQITVNTTAIENIHHDISECQESRSREYALTAQQEARIKNLEASFRTLESKIDE